jgi:hypothetical protein
LFVPTQHTLQGAQFEEPLPFSILLSSDRPGIISVGVLLQKSHDKQQQQQQCGGQNPHRPDIASTTKKQIQSNKKTPTTIAIMYSTGKSLPVSLAVKFEGDVISKYEEFVVLLEFALISTKLPFMTVTEVLRRPKDNIGRHKDKHFR